MKKVKKMKASGEYGKKNIPTNKPPEKEYQVTFIENGMMQIHIFYVQNEAEEFCNKHVFRKNIDGIEYLVRPAYKTVYRYKK